MARVIKVQASEDIWHLSIEDLLAPPREPARTAGPGPFVINLRTSTATIGLPPKGLLPFDRLNVYQLVRSHDGRPQFRLRLGIIESELEADTLLSMVREHYPGAIKEMAEDDDKVAIAGAACTAEAAKPACTAEPAKPAFAAEAAKPARAAEPAKPASAVAEAKAPVVQVPEKVAATPARQPAPESAEPCRWDIDELLPELAAVRAPGREPTPPNCTAPKGGRKPTPKLTSPRRSAKAQMPPHPAAASRARPSAPPRSTPPLEETPQSQSSRGVTKTPPVERQQPQSVAPDRVVTEPRTRVNPGQPLAKTAPLSVDVSHGSSQAEGAPTSAVVEEIESDPNAITDQVEVLTLRTERRIGAAAEAPLPPGNASSTESSIEQKLLDVPTLEHARPEPDLRRLDLSAPTGPKPVITAHWPAVDSVHAEHRTAAVSPGPTAAAHANPLAASGEDSAADSRTPQRLVVKIGALIDSAETRQKSANAPQSDVNASVAAAAPAASRERIAPKPVSPIPPPRMPQSAGALAGAPLIDSTQTVRALTPLELADGEASRWFAIQLTLCEEPIDAEQVPNLDIFTEYRLYSVTGLEQDRVMHALRVGFFSSELAAEAVAGYLAAYFDSPVIKRVSIAERERFADTSVAARKDVGASGGHAVIELVAPAPLPEPRVDAALSDSGKRAALEATSFWSRLLTPRNR